MGVATSFRGGCRHATARRGSQPVAESTLERVGGTALSKIAVSENNVHTRNTPDRYATFSKTHSVASRPATKRTVHIPAHASMPRLRSSCRRSTLALARPLRSLPTRATTGCAHPFWQWHRRETPRPRSPGVFGAQSCGRGGGASGWGAKMRFSGGVVFASSVRSVAMMLLPAKLRPASALSADVAARGSWNLT